MTGTLARPELAIANEDPSHSLRHWIVIQAHLARKLLGRKRHGRWCRGRAARGRRGKRVSKIDIRHLLRQRSRSAVLADVIQVAQQRDSEPLLRVPDDVRGNATIAPTVSDRPQTAILCDFKSEAVGTRLRPAGGHRRRLHRYDERPVSHTDRLEILFPKQQVPYCRL